MTAVAAVKPETWTPRQGEVLEAALSLLVAGGDKLTMNGVARIAHCSKETLYKWFGDRDGLLVATVQWQAAKVGVPRLDRAHLDARALGRVVEDFGRALLSVLASENSVALNRVAVSHAGTTVPDLGTIVLQNGRLEMGRRLKPVLEAGRAVGLLRFADSEQAFRTFFGLVVRDVQIRLLLGDRWRPSEAEIDAEAKAAAEQFFALFGT
ncbi:MAG: TetR/AcrR family transcriptional regulator C-terminal domain-containing protein [Alphaproteobacteria bacterium]|nr:TetR/AcrR family transcriptional regulator C-terminal domain-containing protein [Alphaproteobacteria bacterium]